MNVYVAIIEDRHTDVGAEVFSDKNRAIEYAKETARAYCRFEEDYKENAEEDKVWCFRVSYSCEGDSITVVERELL